MLSTLHRHAQIWMGAIPLFNPISMEAAAAILLGPFCYGLDRVCVSKEKPRELTELLQSQQTKLGKVQIQGML